MTQVNSVGISQRLTTSVSTAVFKSVSSVQCPLPALKSYAVKISNDGTHTSVAESVFVLYQSDCYTCEVAADRTHANCSMRVSPPDPFTFYNFLIFFYNFCKILILLIHVKLVTLICHMTEIKGYFT